MDFLCVSSLSNLSYTKIALAVFYNPDVYKIAFNHYFSSKFHKQKVFQLKNVLDVAVDKISTLIIPANCHQKLKSLILNMTWELKFWLKDFRGIFDIKQLENIRPIWTNELAIDGAKTAKMLMETTHFDAVVCFMLACQYGLFHDALCFWNNMTVDQKTAVSSKPKVKRSGLGSWILDSEFEESQKDLVSFVAFIESRQLLFDDSVFIILSTKSRKEKKDILLSVVNDSSYLLEPDLKLRCLQMLESDWQKELIKKQPFIVLKCLLTWPFESKFLDVADQAWSYLLHKDFVRLLKIFIDSLKNSDWLNCERAEILKQFWGRSPTSFKDYAKSACIFEILKVVINCNPIESHYNVLEDAYKKYLDYMLRVFFDDLEI